MFREFRIVCAVAALAIGVSLGTSPAAAAEPTPKDVLKTYADIAQAGYTDSADTARTLKLAVDTFLAHPTDDNLRAARAAWIAARIPYMQTEAFRFGNAIVDDWEGRVNSWPLDEGLIDYVDTSVYGTDSAENALFTANVIANKSLVIGGKKIDTSKITKELLADVLQEAGGVEANVATGYHAVEFLLWGQDLNGTGPGNGNRPATDYDLKNCTHGNCARRAEYLRTVTSLLVDDLTWMAAQWAPDGDARKHVMSGDETGLTAIMTGLGSLSYGELAGERMKLGLMIHDPEEEHDCFSDNTHASHFFDALGIRNVYRGAYRRADRSFVSGPSISDLVKAKSPEVDAEVRAKLDATMNAMNVLYLRALTTESYDQMIGEGNDEGNAVVQHAIDALLDQTKSLERAVATLDLKSIKFEGSDSLDNPSKVQEESKAASGG